MYKIGVSLYSVSRAISAGEFDIFGAIKWIRENGGEHLEVSPGNYCIVNGNEKLCRDIALCAKQNGIELSSYTVGANFIRDTAAEVEEEIKRVKTEVDTAAMLGVRFMRHDAGVRRFPENTLENFEKDLPLLADACGQIADYAARYGITTSVENHGFHVQGSERVQRLIFAVNRPNFRTTLDIGNFLCVDEDPVSAVKNNIPYASMIHFKDFYIRDSVVENEGFFGTSHGRFLRGAIVGHGDINIPAVADVIRKSGYSGFISVEFEGMEECRQGTRIGINTLKKLFA